MRWFLLLLLSQWNQRYPSVTRLSYSLNQLNYLLSLLMHITELCIKINSKALFLSRWFFMYSNNFRVTLFKLFIESNFDYCSYLFLFTSNCNCMTKLCSVFKRNFNFFLNVGLEHADLDEPRKLLRPLRLMPLNIGSLFRLSSCFTVFSTIILQLRSWRALFHPNVLLSPNILFNHWSRMILTNILFLTSQPVYWIPSSLFGWINHKLIMRGLFL